MCLKSTYCIHDGIHDLVFIHIFQNDEKKSEDDTSCNENGENDDGILQPGQTSEKVHYLSLWQLLCID